MTIDHRRLIGTVRSCWTSLERDWQSVAIGIMIVALTATLEIRIPW
ncbi:hypothetical protein [Halostagnicola bangensis]